MASHRDAAADNPALTAAQFQILLALSEGDRHGYAIMQEIERRSSGAVEIGAGTLYRSIRQLVDAGLITEVKPRRVVHAQRRHYRITPAGRRQAQNEASRLNALLRWARAADLLRSSG